MMSHNVDGSMNHEKIVVVELSDEAGNTINEGNGLDAIVRIPLFKHIKKKLLWNKAAGT